MTHSTKTFTVTKPCRVTLGRAGSPPTGSPDVFTLYSITSEDAEENKLIGEDDSPFACWDADVLFVEDGLRIVGSDGPGGGAHATVELFVPSALIRALEIEEE
jgi:hypothetical protein